MNGNQRAGNGPEAANGGIGHRLDEIGADARKFVDDARGAVHELGSTLDIKGRVQRHPYGMVLAALGVGYVLGGGLFTPTTARLLRLGMKLAALPLVKDELIGMAEATVDSFARRGGVGPEAAGPASYHPSEGGNG